MGACLWAGKVIMWVEASACADGENTGEIAVGDRMNHTFIALSSG